MAEEIAIDCPELASMVWNNDGSEWLKGYRNGEKDIQSLDALSHFSPGAWKKRAVVALLAGAVQELSAKIEYLESQLSNQ
jgi:hypothetical protein